MRWASTARHRPEPSRRLCFSPCRGENLLPSLAAPAARKNLSGRGFVRSLNLSRRHLTLAQKKEVAKHIFEREPGRTSNSVAQEVGLAPHTAQKVQDNISNLKNSNKTGLPAGGAAELPPAEPAKSRNPVARLVDANL